jgi:GH24 family phage-related lysozyme (muramidase)
MDLNDLFVSHKQVSPVEFNVTTPEIEDNIYINYGRAQKAASGETQEKSEPTEEVSYNWKVPEVSDYYTRLKEHIIKEEGFRDKAYKDGKYYSIGYGFNDAKYKEGDTMSREEADIELDRQLKTREGIYRKRFGSKWDNLSDNQRIALMSYGYNTGDNNIINGDIAKYLDTGDMEKLRDSIRINTFNGSYYEPLEKRRQRERLLFDS